MNGLTILLTGGAAMSARCPRCHGLAIYEPVVADCLLIQYRCLNCGNRIEPGLVMDYRRRNVVKRYASHRSHARKEAT